MKFEEALVEYRKGKKIRRYSWVSSHYTETTTLYYTCVMADDWQVLEEPKPPKLMAPCLYRYDLERDTAGWVRLSDVVFASLEEAKMTYQHVIQWPAIPDANGFYSVEQE